jgi:hypothetical protein
LVSGLFSLSHNRLFWKDSFCSSYQYFLGLDCLGGGETLQWNLEADSADSNWGGGVGDWALSPFNLKLNRVVENTFWKGV